MWFVVMKHNISIIFILSLLMLSLLVVPVAGAADGDKTLVKEMVQAPADYSVDLGIYDYYHDLLRFLDDAASDFFRQWYTNWRLYRLILPG